MALWGLDWSAVLPWTFGDVTVEPGTFDEATRFMEAHYATCFPPAAGGLPFTADPMTPAKRRFGEAMDVFLMRHEGGVIGLLMGHPTDWSSYYLRSAAMLPAFRDRHVMGRALTALEAPLRRSGVARVEAEVSVGNAPALQVMARLGWLVTATSNTDRWGAMLRFTRLLGADAEDAFVQHFCAIDTRARPAPQHSERSLP